MASSLLGAPNMFGDIRGKRNKLMNTSHIMAHQSSGDHAIFTYFCGGGKYSVTIKSVTKSAPPWYYGHVARNLPNTFLRPSRLLSPGAAAVMSSISEAELALTFA